MDLTALRSTVDFWLTEAIQDRATHKTYGPTYEALVDNAVGAICRLDETVEA